MSRILALFLISLALPSVSAAETFEEFAALRTRADKMAASAKGRAYDHRFSDSFAKPLQAALKTCTENTKRPYPVNIVFVINADGSTQRVIPGPDQPVSACITEKLQGLTLPRPPGDQWLVALNINIDDPGPGEAPTEFVTQILEPTGGKLLRPNDWFYTESHNSASYTWIISREDASKAPYTTGVQIQMFAFVKKGTGKTPKKFVLDFVAKKKKEAAKVVNACGETKQETFTRVCLETEEGPYHILYSAFWENKLDWVIVCTAGTRKDLWETYNPAFQRIGHFEVIDLKRFQDEKKKETAD